MPLKQSKRVPTVIVDFEINPDFLAEGMTQSEMQTWDNCPEKWYLTYNLLLQSKGSFSWALTYGTWIHAALEEFYASKGKRWTWDPVLPSGGKFLTNEIMQQSEYWMRLGKLQMEIYTSHYKGDFTFFDIDCTEEVVDYTFEGVRLKGMIDMYVYSKAHKGFYVLDHKTTSRIDPQTIQGWDFRLQFMFYCWLGWKMWPKKPVHGFFINAIKKPALRQGKDESLDTFLQRVQTDMLKRPEEYFYRDRMRLKKADLQHFEDTILRPKLQRVKMLLDPSIPPSVKSMLVRNKNTDHCLTYGKPCAFLNACKNGLEIERHAFTVRANKHEELESE